MKTVKVLIVETDNDYAMVDFEKSGVNPLEVWKEVMKNGGNIEMQLCVEEGYEEDYIYTAKEFPIEALSALEFAKNQEDYESSKHNSWMIIKED